MRTKLCKICKEPFPTRNSLQRVCSVPCAITMAKQDKARKEARERREGLQRIKSRAQWIREAQAACNAYVRTRDEGLPCISCGTTADVQYAAGHYRTTAAAPHLRFNEDNIHKQCNRYCNCAKSGNITLMRIGMIERIGLARVEALENNKETHKWSIEELKIIKAEYTMKLRELIKQREDN